MILPRMLDTLQAIEFKLTCTQIRVAANNFGYCAVVSYLGMMTEGLAIWMSA